MKLKDFYLELNEDFEQATARIPKETSLIRFLRRMASDNDFEKLTSAVEAKDYKTVFTVTHNLKGVYGNLSLNRLAAATSDLCEDVRGGEPSSEFDALYKKASQLYSLVVEAIGRIED